MHNTTELRCLSHFNLQCSKCSVIYPPVKEAEDRFIFYPEIIQKSCLLCVCEGMSANLKFLRIRKCWYYISDWYAD